MNVPADYHMHTPLCRHAVGTQVELAQQAVAVGLQEIGFSDHNPMPVDNYDEWRMPLSDLERYVADVNEARQRFPQLKIKLALEVDYIPGYESWVRDLRGRYHWDYFIGSVHYLGDKWAMDSPNELSEWKRRNTFEVWTAYFERLTQAAESGLFDIIGHADLCKKFAFYPEQDCAPLYRRFLTSARTAGVAIELNTAGLRKDCREIYPNRELLEIAHELGVPITFGSDAHAPGEVGMDFQRAVELARSVGYRHCLRFTAGKRETCTL